MKKTWYATTSIGNDEQIRALDTATFGRDTSFFRTAIFALQNDGEVALNRHLGEGGVR